MAISRRAARLPREVWIASLTLAGLEAKTIDELLKKVLQRMEETLPHGPDIICLPETFAYHGASSYAELSSLVEGFGDRVIAAFAAFSKQHRCHTICPIYNKTAGRIYNSAIVFNRSGAVIGEYHKVHPTTDEMESGVTPGAMPPPVFKLDFGTIGIQTCFDVNWLQGWQSLKECGAEIVFWPSAFPGGRMLNALAWMTQAYAVTSTWSAPARVIDVTGQDLAVSGQCEHWVCAAVNLEKAFIHTWPYMDKVNALRAKYGQKVRVVEFHDEGWAIIESISPDVSLDKVLAEFHIPRHREHIRIAQQRQDQSRPPQHP